VLLDENDGSAVYEIILGIHQVIMHIPGDAGVAATKKLNLADSNFPCQFVPN
jgi:hypothetical protein